MSKRNKRNDHHRRQLRRDISVRGVRREPADYRKLARVVLALAQAEADAAAQHRGETDPTDRPPKEAA
jgi:hypothetical protein